MSTALQRSSQTPVPAEKIQKIAFWCQLTLSKSSKRVNVHIGRIHAGITSLFNRQTCSWSWTFLLLMTYHERSSLVTARWLLLFKGWLIHHFGNGWLRRIGGGFKSLHQCIGAPRGIITVLSEDRIPRKKEVSVNSRRGRRTLFQLQFLSILHQNKCLELPKIVR